jgi:hypothetical protein
VGTVNVGSCAPACPPFYCGVAREGAHCHTRQAPPIRARIGSVSRSGDHFPNKNMLNTRVDFFIFGILYKSSSTGAHVHPAKMKQGVFLGHMDVSISCKNETRCFFRTHMDVSMIKRNQHQDYWKNHVKHPAIILL